MMCYVEHLLITNLFNCAANTIFLISFDFVKLSTKYLEVLVKCHYLTITAVCVFFFQRHNGDH